ncbi:MAG: hypothetical protein ACTH0Y_08645, partial [Luteimonas sp.]
MRESTHRQPPIQNVMPQPLPQRRAIIEDNVNQRAGRACSGVPVHLVGAAFVVRLATVFAGAVAGDFFTLRAALFFTVAFFTADLRGAGVRPWRRSSAVSSS